VLATRGEGGLTRSEQLVRYFYSALLPGMAYTVWLSPDWRCIFRQPAASQVYLIRLTPARQAELTLLDQGACNGHSL